MLRAAVTMARIWKLYPPLICLTVRVLSTPAYCNLSFPVGNRDHGCGSILAGIRLEEPCASYTHL